MPSSDAKAKRRVPTALRRRNIASCDRCKRRRIRCEQTDDDGEACKACLNGGLACESTLPRKQRVYGSVESLNARYRVLDGLVRGLFPDEDVDDLANIVHLAAARKISIHNPEENTSPAEVIDPCSSVTDPFSRPAAMHNITHWPYNIDQTVQGTVVNLPQETCIPAPHGEAHYVGTASSFEFARAIRSLVAKCNRHSEQILGNRRSRLLTEFANLKVSIALEPRIPNHPASIVREEGRETGAPGSLSAQNTPTTADTISPTDTSSRTSSPYRRWLQNLLPSRATSDRLIDAFFGKVHPNYLLFHRGTFQTRYESIWHRSPAYKYEAEPGWLCCLFMVLVFGAQALEYQALDNAADLQRRFLRFVRERFQHLALTASLANVQALLLLQLYEHNAGERNTSWMLLGQAARMSIALGIHREGTSHHFDSIERNTRRLVWFTLYSFEQYTSLMLGRPSTIKALEVNVKLPDEAMLDGHDYPPDYLKHASSLMDLTSQVRHIATAASPNCFDQSLLVSLLDSISSLSVALQAWHTWLPQHLQPDWQFVTSRHERAVLMLHITFHHISSVLTRPYLLCRVNTEVQQQQVGSSPRHQSVHPNIEALSQQCVRSSSMAAQLLGQLSAHSMLEGVVWTDCFYLYHVVLVLCLDHLAYGISTTAQGTLPGSSNQAQVLQMIELCQNHRLGPTYQILSQVAIQFAHIVGFARGATLQDEEEVSLHDACTASAGPQNASAEDRGMTWDQNEVWVPFVEPISGMGHYSNHNMPWDFFNVGGVDNEDASFWPPTSDSFYQEPHHAAWL